MDRLRIYFQVLSAPRLRNNFPFHSFPGVAVPHCGAEIQGTGRTELESFAGVHALPAARCSALQLPSSAASRSASPPPASGDPSRGLGAGPSARLRARAGGVTREGLSHAVLSGGGLRPGCWTALPHLPQAPARRRASLPGGGAR